MSPWDKERDNLQDAVIGTAIINEIKAVRKEWGSKSVKFLKVDDLLLKFERKDKFEGKTRDAMNASEYHRAWKEDHERRKAEILASKPHTRNKRKPT